MRKIEFRGKTIEDDMWAYGYYLYDEFFCKHYITCVQEDDSNPYMWEVRPETVGQYTEVKNFFTGDILLKRTPYIKTQTHRGRNIPNGSYTEYLGPEIKEEYVVIEFKDGMFGFQYEDEFRPIGWEARKYHETDLQLLWGRAHREWREWHDDLKYIFSEYLSLEYDGKNMGKLLDYLGLVKAGNIHDNSELLENKQ